MILRYDRKHRQSATKHAAWRIWHAFGRVRPLVLMLILLLPALLFGDYETHKVKKGDTLYGLSKRYGVSVEQIKKLNKLSSDNLSIGQSLKIKEKPKPKPKPAPSPAKTPDPKPGTSSSVIITPPPPPITQEQTQPQIAATPAVAAAQIGSVAGNLPDDYYHEVRPSEGAYRISQNYGLNSADFFKWNGKNSWDEFIIHPGDRLIIKDPAGYNPPSRQAETNPQAAEPRPGASAATVAKPDTVVIVKTYTVRPKDTLYSISKAYNMTVDELKRLNNLSSNDIKVGQLIYLAGSPPPPGASYQAPMMTEADLETTEAIRSDLFIPTSGKVTSEYGIRNGKPHKGIDIAAKPGTPIYAVLDGVVVFSGPQGNYGNVIVIEHPDFVMTVYAHNERNLVNVNDTVKRGQMIAQMGSTGNSSGSHLHFEYRIKGKAINPRKVLSL